MILYTTMPQELVFPVDESEFSKQMEVSYDGIPMMVERTDDDHYLVIRVMSSDPQHFLDNRYLPGTKIPLR